MDILKNLNRTDENLFYSRNDSYDIRMGDSVLRNIEDYQSADVIIIGCPQDEGVKRNKGRTGARTAPSEIRKFLYKYPVSESHKNLRLLDLGDIKIAKNLEDTHTMLYETVRQFLSDMKKVIVLGGGNDISYPDCCAMSDVFENNLVINIDKHLDVRADLPRNSGTPYRQLLEEKRISPEMFHEVGINSFANSPAYLNYVTSLGAHIHYLGQVRENGVGATLLSILRNNPCDSIFIGLDMDVVCAAEAPGVSDPSPMGLTAREICEAADIAALNNKVKLIEITEVNPEYDRDGMTCKLAANFIMRALVSAV